MGLGLRLGLVIVGWDWVLGFGTRIGDWGLSIRVKERSGINH